MFLVSSQYLPDYEIFSVCERQTTTDERVLNAAARLVSGMRKYDRGLSQILHADLHWLNDPDVVRYKLGVTVHRFLHNKVQQYLVDCCIPVSDIISRDYVPHVVAC